MTPGQVFILVAGMVTLASAVAMGLSRSWAHRSTLVLFLAWAVGQDWWLRTGDPIPMRLYLLTDIGAIALMASWAAKREWMIFAVYPAMWMTYAMTGFGLMSAFEAWWTLYVLALAQFLLSGPWPALLRNRTAQGRRSFLPPFGLARKP